MKLQELSCNVELSILIPVHNEECVARVSELKRQCDAIKGMSYEIIVMDDGSTLTNTIEANRAISHMKHCTLVEHSDNHGSAATRNELADISHYKWILFLDSDMEIADNSFIMRYIAMMNEDAVINGGIAIAERHEMEGCNLRYMYERREERNHVAAKRKLHPYQSFRSTNFMIPKAWMVHCRFDADKAGYEDVFFGRILEEHRHRVIHIDNPTIMHHFEDNAHYMDKIDHSLDVLYAHRHDFRSYSRLITCTIRLKRFMPLSLVRTWHRLFGQWERRVLTSSKPNLFVFRLYQLGYYVSKTK